MKTLFTAFKGTNNTSFQLVNRLGNNSIFLTNSFQGIEKDIASIAFEYDAAIMLGVDKTLNNKIRIEACAKYNQDLLHSNFNITSLENKLEDFKVSYITSSKPASTLCNAAYYHMLKKNSNTIFVHIPSIRGMRESLMNRLFELLNALQ